MKPIHITDDTFKKEVVESNTLTLVDFWAEWCGPCRLIAPILDELSAEYKGEVKFTKLDVDENPSTAMAFSVRSIPTLIVFRNGKPVNRIIGYMPKDELKRRIEDSRHMVVA
ncbi:MAG: thioredoxin [Ignavibacteriae bacterium]|nr:thioredoxin [Ignavibacteriota bacterium]